MVLDALNTMPIVKYQSNFKKLYNMIDPGWEPQVLMMPLKKGKLMNNRNSSALRLASLSTSWFPHARE
jgi:hypothetical protein